MSTRRSARLSAASSGLAAATPPVPPPPAAATPKGSRKRKAAAAAAAAAPAPAPAAPTTPVAKNKRRRATTTAGKASSAVTAAAAPPLPPPQTPTPSNAALLGEPVAGGGGAGATPKPRPAAVRRLASPRATNAQLVSPESSRVAATAASTTAPPGPPPPSPLTTTTTTTGGKTTTTTVTTENLLEVANAHLVSVDARMRPLVEKNHCRVFSPQGLAERVDPFESLCSGIISQQVSGAAARAIKGRFVALFHSSPPHPPPPPPPAPASATTAAGLESGGPSQVAACPLERLRSCGLSQRKAEYVAGLADKFRTGELSAQLLADAPYDEVVRVLTAVRGLGLWSVEMFACFGLKRMDVFSLGDLGVQRGMAAFEGRDVAKLKAKGGGKFKYMSERDMRALADRFAPYRSLFMWYMWRVEETDISTME
ncbi:DNA glycosylase [Xylariaceae sp. FL0804]|nr:DNA glycosylase [Xylariaceae sp. FL0804]